MKIPSPFDGIAMKLVESRNLSTTVWGLLLLMFVLAWHAVLFTVGVSILIVRPGRDANASWPVPKALYLR
jgi:hypothetical protein